MIPMPLPALAALLLVAGEPTARPQAATPCTPQPQCELTSPMLPPGIPTRPLNNNGIAAPGDGIRERSVPAFNSLRLPKSVGGQ